MFGTRLSSVAASAVLLLGSGAIAMAQAGPSDPPRDATDHARSNLETLEVVPETATDAVGDERDGHPEGEDATAFSDWVRGLGAEGCERGLTIAANARKGPTTFTEEEAVGAPADHPAFTRGDCTEAGEPDVQEPEAADEDAGPPAHAGPPADAGPPAGAGPSGDAGPPDDRGPPTGAGPPNRR